MNTLTSDMAILVCRLADNPPLSSAAWLLLVPLIWFNWRFY